MSTFFGSVDDFMRMRAGGGKNCPLCGRMMEQAGPFPSCSQGHDEIAFSGFPREFITKSDSAATQCRGRGIGVRHTGQYFVIDA
jgi:hypothetical protein